nr:uncharacterized protein LOC127340357 [Lolium perenne]
MPWQLCSQSIPPRLRSLLSLHRVYPRQLVAPRHRSSHHHLLRPPPPISAPPAPVPLGFALPGFSPNSSMSSNSALAIHTDATMVSASTGAGHGAATGGLPPMSYGYPGYPGYSRYGGYGAAPGGFPPPYGYPSYPGYPAYPMAPLMPRFGPPPPDVNGSSSTPPSSGPAQLSTPTPSTQQGLFPGHGVPPVVNIASSITIRLTSDNYLF